MNLSRKEIVFSNLLGGLAWGIGSVLGATAVVAIIGFILKGLGVFNAIGTVINQLVSTLSI